MRGMELMQHRKMELAYYTAWHSGLFSQPFRSGYFPDFARFAPAPPGVAASLATPEQLRTKLAVFAASHPDIFTLEPAPVHKD